MSKQQSNLPYDVEKALKTYLDAPTWSAKKHILEANHDLLLTDSRRVFEVSSWIAGLPEARSNLSPMMKQQEILYQSYSNGIDVAFSERNRGLSRYYPLGEELWHQFIEEEVGLEERFAEAIYREDRSRNQLIQVDDLTWEPLNLNIQNIPVLLVRYPTFFTLYRKDTMDSILIIPWVQIEGTDLAPTKNPGKVDETSVLIRFKVWIEQRLLRFYFFLDTNTPQDAQHIINAITYRRNIFMQGLK